MKSVWNQIKGGVIYIRTYRKKFTGMKDIDYVILKQLNDDSLNNLCQTNKYISELCENERFWEERLKERIHPSLVNKPKTKTWRDYYRKVNEISDFKMRELVRNVLVQVSNRRITKDAVEYIAKIVKSFWRDLKELPNNTFKESLKKIITEELHKHVIYYIHKPAIRFGQYDRRNILEYLIAEIIDLSDVIASDKNKRTISKMHVLKTIERDEELDNTFKPYM